MKNYYQALRLAYDSYDTHIRILQQQEASNAGTNYTILKRSHIFEIPTQLVELLLYTKAPKDDKFQWALPYNEIYLDLYFKRGRNTHYGIMLNSVESTGEKYPDGRIMVRTLTEPRPVDGVTTDIVLTTFLTSPTETLSLK